MSDSRKVSIVDVATAAKVSVTTVSHVLSGRRPASEATRARVLQVIEELGYRPSVMAQSMRTQRTNTVALMVPDITNPFYPVLSRGISDTLSDEWRLLIYNSDADVAKEREFLAQMVASGVDGMVVASFWLTEEDVLNARAGGVPLVSIGDSLSGERIDTVVGADAAGAEAMMRHILSKGHRTIGVIAGPRGQTIAEARLEGARRAADSGDFGEVSLTVIHTDFTTEGGRAAATAMLASPSRPTAFVCANDLAAIGALHAAIALGLSVPGDIAIAGYDDIDAAPLINPPLSTVRNPAYEIGQEAGRLLLSRMEHERSVPARRQVVQHRVIERQSA